MNYCTGCGLTTDNAADKNGNCVDCGERVATGQEAAELWAAEESENDREMDELAWRNR